jgi:N-acetylneuraminic acid mutarotase
VPSAATANVTASVTSAAVTRFRLVNAATDDDINLLATGSTIDLRKLGSQLSVRAETSGAVGSVKFVLDGRTFRVENGAPYAIKGDVNGDYLPWTPSIGNHTLTATPYTGDNATGTAGKGLTINFSVVGAAGIAPTATVTNWRTVAPSPVSRAEAVGGVVNGKLYVLGGLDGVIRDGHTSHDHYFSTPRSDVYDPATNRWTRLANMPEAFTHASGVVVGNTIWFVGGYRGNHPGPGYTHVWKYDTAADKWSRGPDLPAPRGAGAAALVGRSIHFFGGLDNTRGADKADHWALDLDNQAAGWVRKASLLRARNHLSAASVNGQLYAIGGQLDEEEKQVSLTNVERYDPATNTWTRVASLPGPRSHTTSGTFVHKGRIIVVGGETGFEKVRREIFSYDPAANKWTQIGLLPSARSTVVAGVAGNTLIVSTGNSPFETATTWAATLS